MLRELARNLLHNAIRHTPAGGALSVRVLADARSAALVVSDSGPGHRRRAPARGCSSPSPPATCAAARAWAWRSARRSSHALGGSIQLENRENDRRVVGLDATARLPLAHNGS